MRMETDIGGNVDWWFCYLNLYIRRTDSDYMFWIEHAAYPEDMGVRRTAKNLYQNQLAIEIQESLPVWLRPET